VKSREAMNRGRGLLTEREQEVLLGDGSDSYQSNTESEIRHRINNIQQDWEFLRKNKPNLFARLKVAVWYPGWAFPIFEGKYESKKGFSLYKDGDKWNQNYYRDTKISWGKQGGSAGQALTAEILIRESVVRNMTVDVPILKEFIDNFNLNTQHKWKISAFEILDWLHEIYFSVSYNLKEKDSA
jgi:hypothetical protein